MSLSPPREGWCALTVIIVTFERFPPSGSELCIVGGSLQTDKDIEGAIQTLGDHDPNGVIMKHDKTRRMRHALVVR